MWASGECSEAEGQNIWSQGLCLSNGVSHPMPTSVLWASQMVTRAQNLALGLFLIKPKNLWAHRENIYEKCGQSCQEQPPTTLYSRGAMWNECDPAECEVCVFSQSETSSVCSCQGARQSLLSLLSGVDISRSRGGPWPKFFLPKNPCFFGIFSPIRRFLKNWVFLRL